MIARQWRGAAQSKHAQRYVQHLRTEILPALRKPPGFVDASILSRALGNGIEFLVVTRWKSQDAIAGFAGTDPETAVVPVEVAAMMVESDRRATHFEVIE